MTNKQNHEQQIGQHERRERLLNKIDRAFNQPDEPEPLPHSESTERYHIALSQRSHTEISILTRDNPGDPALKVFILLDH